MFKEALSPTLLGDVVRSERFALEGPVNVAAVVVLGGALLALFAWSLRRERQVIGGRNAMLFWGLRAAAVCVALWMLLAPSSIRSEHSTTRKSIAMVVDISDSMHTVDPPETADDYRWAMAASVDGLTGAVAGADRALAAAALASQRLDAATAELRDHRPERIALQSALQAHEAIERVRANLLDVAKSFRPPSAASPAAATTASAAPTALAEQVLRDLDGPGFRSLETLAAAVRGGEDAFQSGWRENIADLQYQMAGIQRRLDELADGLAAPNEAQLTAADVTALHQTRQSSRLQRLTDFVQAIEGPMLQPLKQTADFHNAVFDDTLTRLADHESLSSQLSRLLGANENATADGNEPAQGDRAFTDLTVALEHLRQTGRHQPLAAVVLLTDVGHNQSEGRDPRQAAVELADTPVFVVPIGNTRRVRDVELKSISAPSVVMKDDDVVIEAVVEAYDCEGESLRVELVRDGAVTEYRDLKIDSPTALLRVPFHTQLASVGVQRCQIRVVPLQRELSEENNFDQVQINVTRDQIRVLLADNMPRWEFRYLAQLFRRDDKVQCDELLFHPRIIATGHREQTKAFPVTVDQWAQYDVVMLGDVSAEQLTVSAQQSLTQFLEQRGGTVVMIAGEQSLPHAFSGQPLEALLPVTRDQDAVAAPPEGYAFQITDEGWRHHALMIADTAASTRTAWEFINRNAPFYWLSPYHRAKPATRTLISAAERSQAATDNPSQLPALLTWLPVGRGQVVFLASPETFRLRFLRGDRLHYRFWGQLLRWAIANDLASGSERVRIRTDRPDYQRGDQVQVVVRLSDEAGAPVADAVVEGVAVDAAERRVTIPLTADATDPGRYAGTFQQLPAGIYQVEATGAAVDALLSSLPADVPALPTASFTIRSPLNREILDTRSDPALAQQIADATGGQVLPPTAVGEVLSLIDLAPIVTEKVERLPLWTQWKYLWIVFGCLLSEWAVRKRLGLS